MDADAPALTSVGNFRLAARSSYFHGGTADTLEEVVQHYETQLGFDFTPAEEADLVAFMKAL